ncbi:MAG: phage holin family protein [Pedobacter sp.]|nr:MAG: phage holin family protein [Pedobacter sp.]
MQEKSTKTISEIWADVKTFLNIKLEYYKLTVFEKAAKVMADLITNSIVIIFFIVAFISGAVTLAFYFASLFDSYTAGFGVAAIFFLLLAIVVFLTKDKFIERWIANFAIKRYFEKHYEEDDEKDTAN